MLALLIALLCFAFAASAEEMFVAEVSSSDTEQGVFQVEIIQREIDDPRLLKRVLIYHTHTYEAYEQDASSPYDAIEKWRTKDNAYNVVTVGKALAANLQARGIFVVHDTTAFEPPSLETAYDRSLKMLEERAQAGETYDLYIDLHRDALASESSIKRTVGIGGYDVARFMVLVGQGITGGYAEKPAWQDNLAIAKMITDHLNQQCAGLARDVKIKTGRFNQHISNYSVLIECGMNFNTLEEVLAGIPYLASAIEHTLAQK